jgi:DNA-binding response OmpR family regulator
MLKMVPKNITLLYVEDDLALSYVTVDNLEAAGYQVIQYDNGRKLMNDLPRLSFDLCILDVMLPEVDGYQIAEAIRSVNVRVPILFLSAKSLKEDRIHGLKLGADDYITKPFSIEELLLKIEIFLKRAKPELMENRSIYKVGQYTFDFQNLQLILGAEPPRTLTQREADLLKYLYENKDLVLKRNDILKDVWGSEDYFLGRSMDVFVSRLRKYLSSDERIKILNIHGIGFRFVIEPS